MKIKFPLGLYMKRCCALICAMVLCFSLAACAGDEKPRTRRKDRDTSVAEDNTDEKVEFPTEESDAVDLPCIYKVPLKNIYVNAPNYQEIEEGYTELFIIHESRYVAFTFNTDVTAENAKEAHNVVFDIFKINMQNYEGGVENITIEKEEILYVNGIEVYAFEGTIHYGKGSDRYAKGYAFIMDGVPCEIIGSVIDDEQPEEMIPEISAIVDAMIETVRETA